jgi:VCBS repeat-containing protein
MEPRRLFSGGVEGLVPSGAEYLTGPIFRDLDAHKSLRIADNETSAQAEPRTREIVFVDAGVENFQQFVDDVQNNADDSRNIEVVVLDRDRDGIEQISSHLQDLQDIDAVHIISHGVDGSVKLGETTLNADSLQENSSQIALWANAFTDSGDILFYGCDLASSSIGQNLIDELGALTLTDVAASDDLTGADSQGGDWLLEYNKGKIDSNIAVSAELQQEYRSTLAATAIDDAYNIDENSILSVPSNGVLANDIDGVSVTRVNGSATDVGTEISLASGALLTLNADGSFSYDTNGMFEYLGTGAGGGPTSATDSFTYEAMGSSDPNSTATVTITITGVDDPAIIGDDTSFTGDELDPVFGTLNATDVEGLTDGTYFTITNQAANGTAAIDPATGAWTFTPTIPDWFGVDSFTVTVTDDLGGTTTKVVSIMLDTLATQAVDDNYSVSENATLNSTSGWFDNNWPYRRTLSFDNTLRTENLLDFPVLIKLDSSTIDYAKTHDSGDDLRFFDQDGTLLAHEIEVWNESGTSYVWVKVPQIDASSDTDSIVMYYGNADVVGNGQDAAGVWSNYQAVYHLNENPGATGTVIDSAGNHDGTNANSTDTAGVIGNAQDFDGSKEYIDLGDDIAWLNNASGATLSIWTNSDSINGGSNDIIGFTRYDVGSTSSSRFALIRNSDEIRLIARTMDDESDTITVQTTTSPLVAGQWQHITGTVDYASDVDNIKIYVDGVLEGTFSHNFTLDAIPNTVSNQSAIGSNEGGVGNYFDGQLDEARILLGVQSEQAIAAQYAAMTGSLVTVGFEQTVNGVLANDFDREGDALSVVEVNGNPGTVGAATALPSGAIVTLNADGSFLYDTFSAFESLGAGASTTDSFTYQINDGNGNTHTATVTITIDGVDDAAAISGNTSYSGNEGDLVGGTLIASDVEGLVDGTYFTVTGAATNGTATIDPATGAWTFVPTDPNWFGTDQFTVTVTDDLDGTTTQVVSITLAAVDDPAIISGDISYSGSEGNTVGGDMDAVDVEGLSDGTYFTVTSAATNGTAAIDSASGIWTFVPTDSNWFGTDQFTVTVTDDLDGTTTQVVNITLAAQNDLPVIGGANTGTIYEDIDVASGNISTSGSLTISDPDAGESIFIAETINGAYGTLTMDTAGNWRYQADNNSSAIQALNATDTLVDSLAVTSADGTTYNIVININGAGEPPTVTTDEPEVVPTEVDEPPSEPREVPEATLNEEVLTALEEFDSEEIYTTPQIRDPQATNQDPDGISQFTDSKPSSSSYTRIAIPQQDPVLPQEFKTQGIDIDSLRFAASDDEDFNARLEMALLERIEQMSMAIDSDASGRNADNVEVQVFIGATTSLTAGIVSWVLRGGSLLASLMGTAPLLNRFDPLPILKSRNDKEDVEPDDDDDTEITGPVGKNHRRVDNMFNDNKYGPSRGKYLDE